MSKIVLWISVRVDEWTVELALLLLVNARKSSQLGKHGFGSLHS